MVAKKCIKCGVDPGLDHQVISDDTIKKLKLVNVLESKGLHRSMQGDWEAYHSAIHKCSKCKRYFHYTVGEEWEPVGIAVITSIRPISKEKADDMMEKSKYFDERDFYKDKPLAPMTSIQLGGKAKYFKAVDSEDELLKALRFAKKENIRVQILGGGSNTIFQDQGFNGIVLRYGAGEFKVTVEGEDAFVTVQAGMHWNSLVLEMTQRGYAGIETLAGIPGDVGATPIQNVGAYGQEVSNVITEVKTIDRETLKTKIFKNKECKFGYRTSRFKKEDKDKYVIVEVTFKLEVNGRPVIAYPQLEKRLNEEVNLAELSDGSEVLEAVRSTVIKIRSEKSMIVFFKDPNSVSCGSFFTNPIMSKTDFDKLKEKAAKSGIDEIPNFETDGKIKVPAAWLLEKSGFHKGFRNNQPVGLSENHNLAIVNRGGTTADVIKLQKEIQQKVRETFGIKLEREPELVE